MLQDRIYLKVAGGTGGPGCASYKYRPDKKAVPDGGNGGHGGSVVFRADEQVADLGHFRQWQHIAAHPGERGANNRRRGRNGEDIEVRVPVGTRLYEKEKGFLIRHLSSPGEKVVVATGGKGGPGNQGGKKAGAGEQGQSLDVELLFRLQADVFLVGLPNSGKSTLMNALTRTRLPAEPYPFSTRAPKRGVYAVSDYQKVTLCELPSIYGASHEGRGLGLYFLAHLEKARCIFYVLDPFSRFCASLDEGLTLLKQEVKAFRADLLNIPYAVVVTKMDAPGAEDKIRSEGFSPRQPCFFISAGTGEGMSSLKNFLKERFG